MDEKTRREWISDAEFHMEGRAFAEDSGPDAATWAVFSALKAIYCLGRAALLRDPR